MYAQQQHILQPQQQQHQQAFVGGGSSGGDESKTIWVGDLQYWMDESYLNSCFGHTNQQLSTDLISFTIELCELSMMADISEEEKKRLLHCVIIGGGPTGVEFSGELSNFILKDLNEIMSSFDIGLSQYATKHLTKCGVHLKKGVVKEVHPKKIVISDGTDVPIWPAGMQYIPWYEIQKIENCAATVLMGCCSGSISYKGCYNPHGAVISYLLAGSLVMITYLWDVTSPDIDRLGRSMLNAMFKERLISSGNCTLCNSVVQEFELGNKRCNKGNGKKKVLGERKLKEDRLNINFGHRQMIGPFVSEARDTCNLPFLNGAAPVCYGVPTVLCQSLEK
ncbi:hypothetical protein GIB67_002025 [Kingdonia uniflora]|uniref:FAD/NAD(P)-binding domain-containing protein n=1 Tax=Kingdonia uniflora TaxID=39325 RepID=A0A7J7MA85_9MAGN|nr:hypothetical protein GIB67_002025 [Kingdonia uniflora]